MKFLFESKFAPLTNHVGFIEADIDNILLGFKDWFHWLNQTCSDIVEYEIHDFSGSLEDCLKQIGTLLPYDVNKRLLMQTKGKWIAYVDNYSFGSEINNFKVVAKRINERYIGIRAWEQNFGKQPNANGWGGGDFIYSNPATGQYRSVGLRYELTKWEFDQYGDPLPFEELEVYKAKPIKNRLTPEMVDRYAKQFGIDFFNEDFYMPPGSKAYLIETSSKYLDTVETLTLEENRKRLGLE